MNSTFLQSRFGPIRQIAYIVANIDDAIRAWNIEMGVGPFAVARDVAPFAGAHYRGEPCDDLRLNLAFAYLGDVQLELIEQLDERPSIYREMLDRGNPGLHHYCFGVDDYSSACQSLMKTGFEPVVQAGDADNGMMYCQSRTIPGLILEIIPWNDNSKRYFDGTRQYLAGVDQDQLIHEIIL